MRIASTAVALLFVACASSQPAATTTTESAATSTTSTLVATTTTTAATTTSSTAAESTTTRSPESLVVEVFPVPPGSRPHDVAPAADGGVWYTAQGSGDLGWLNPETGETLHIPLGEGSRPHGVIVDEEGTPWVTDGGLNAIVEVDPSSHDVTIYHLPDTSGDVNLNTAVFADDGFLWFTGQEGVVARMDPGDGEMVVFPAPGGSGPYGITVTPDGDVFYASLAGSYVGEVTVEGEFTVHQPPTADQGARRVWTDSLSRVWVSEWNSGNVSRLDPATGSWATWELPGDAATYAVFVDDQDIVWLSDFGTNALVRFDPTTESFTSYPLPHNPGEVRQIHGRPGEVWGAESAADHLVLIRTR
ncbi:MAG TPA: lyase [Acidimicrobiia bacterium]|nr:lyase [Acidimicrobiia bacterium]